MSAWGLLRETFPVADGITGIDTQMVGRHLVTSAYLIQGDEPALIETGPATSSPAVVRGLGSIGLDPNQLAHIVVTHIHLDHAGGVGTLARRFPRATVWVCDRGAPHLADPTKLVASTQRVYGTDRARELFGDVEPVPGDRIRAVVDGDIVPLGNRSLEVLYTPGHASHHVCLIDSGSGALFTGDAMGVHLPDVGVLRPATPPPDFDVQLAVASIARIRARARSVLLLSHFGAVAEVDHLCDLAAARILRWSQIVRDALKATDDPDRIAALLERQGAAEYFEDADEQIDMERYDVLSSVRVNAMGLIRYWKKRMQREAAEMLDLASEAPPAPGAPEDQLS
jgi:glyoxylase-like metal-dependent hydrolase (beta-lactamase superfamily II)